jgi:hypothetical protein
MIPSLVGQHSPVRPAVVHKGCASQAPLSVGVGAVSLPWLDGLLAGLSDASEEDGTVEDGT